MKKVVILTFLWAGLHQGAQAQFFKKILDNVKNTAQNRANDKASQTTDKAIDKALQPGGNKTGSSGSTGTSGTTGAAGAAADNANDTSASDLTMKALNRMIGGGGVSPQDSAAAVRLFMTAQGGSGVYYESTTTITTKKGNQKDTSAMYFTNSGEGRAEMSIPIPGVRSGKMVIIGRAGQPRYSMNINDEEKTYSLNVIDTGLINSGINDYTAVKVGEETVDGYHCMHARLTSKNRFASSTMDIWTSTAVPGYNIYKKLVAVNKITPGMLMALDKVGCNGYMVKMVTAGKDHTMTMELVKAEEKSLSASLFKIPAGYKETDGGILGSMFSGMKKNN